MTGRWRRRWNASIDIMLFGVLGVAAVLTLLGSERPDLDSWRWLLGPTIGIGLLLLAAIAVASRNS